MISCRINNSKCIRHEKYASTYVLVCETKIAKDVRNSCGQTGQLCVYINKRAQNFKHIICNCDVY